MWRVLRIAILLFILATVAQAAWLARGRATDWNNTVRVAIYPINGDGSGVSSLYASQLRDAGYEPIAAFFKEEGRKYALRFAQAVDVRVAPPVASQPPGARPGRSTTQRSERPASLPCSHRSSTPSSAAAGSTGSPPAGSRRTAEPRLPHSTGLQKGLIGVVNAFARSDMDGSNNVVITHELLHTLGATDKYDFASNRPLFPDGYADPNAQPLHPQVQAEIMAGRIPVSETQAETPSSMSEVAIGMRTAREINWIK